MEAAIIMAITELLKMGIMFLISNAKQAGLTLEQIDAAFRDARAQLERNDPNKIPD